MRTSLVLSLLALCLSSFSAAEPIPADDFHELARAISDEALHDALHTLDLRGGKQYKHGIFEKDRDALEAVRRERVEEAIRIVKLAKRQNNTETGGPTPPPPHSTTTTTTTSTTSSAPNLGSTTTTTTSSTTSTLSMHSTTSTTSSTTSSTSSSTNPPVNPSSTPSRTDSSPTTSTTSPPQTQSRSTSVSFTTSKRTTTITLPGGGVETVTDIVTLFPTETSSSTNSGPPGLVTDSAARKIELGGMGMAAGWMYAAALIGAGFVGGLVL